MKLHRKTARKSQPRCVVILVNNKWANVVKQTQNLTCPRSTTTKNHQNKGANINRIKYLWRTCETRAPNERAT